MEKVPLEKHVNFPTIEEVYLAMVSLTEVFNPIATSILNMFQRVLIDATFYLTEENT